MGTGALARSVEIPRRFPAGVVVAIALAFFLGFTAYVLGSRRSSAEAMTGRAHIGNHVASIERDGWFYGVSDSIAWIDASGSFHEDGWPACLRPVGSTKTVRFGAANVEIPDSVGFRPVVWIDCRVA